MAIDPASVERYLHEHIPLSRDMGVRVARCDDDGVVLEVPLEPNLNHESNAFGGSISALATLAGWSLLYGRLRARAEGGRIVIQRSQVEYLVPIESGFRAETLPVPESDWTRLGETLARRGRGRITVRCDVMVGTVRAAAFEGNYVVME